MLHSFITIIMAPNIIDPQINLYQDGFGYATPEQWALRPDASDFGNPSSFKCAAAYFSYNWNHCDYSNGLSGQVVSTPADAPGVQGMEETWLVRDPNSPCH